MLWASTDNTDESGGDPLDENYGPEDLSEKFSADCRKDCLDFFKQHYDDISGDLERAGHDFWLTRCGHGAGFWDGGWPAEVGKRLTIAAKIYGNVDVSVGEDGKIYG
jgi:hypothetical protein